MITPNQVRLYLSMALTDVSMAEFSQLGTSLFTTSSAEMSFVDGGLDLANQSEKQMCARVFLLLLINVLVVLNRAKSYRYLANCNENKIRFTEHKRSLSNKDNRSALSEHAMTDHSTNDVTMNYFTVKILDKKHSPM